MALRDQQKNPILEVILGTVKLPFTLAGAAAGGLISFGRRYGRTFENSGRQSPERAKVDTSKWTLELLKRVEWRRFEELCAAYFEALDELNVPPGNRLKPLRGNREGQHSIRINDQYRICFRWADDGAHDVEITDYH